MRKKKLALSLLSVSMSATAFFGPVSAAAFTVPAAVIAQSIVEDSSIDLTKFGENLAQASGVSATASSSEADSVAPSKLIDGVAAKGNHWGSDMADENCWVEIDLGEVKTVGMVRICWESTKANSWNVQTSVDETDWETQYSQSAWPAGKTEKNDAVVFGAPTEARYIRINITDYSASENVDTGIVEWNTIGIYEVEVYGARNGLASSFNASNYSDNLVNQTGVVMSANSQEADSVSAAKAGDGNTGTHWGSDTTAGPHWLMANLGSVQDVDAIRVLWESTKVTAWDVQLSEDGTTWQTVHTQTSWPEGKTDKNDTIVLDSTIKAQYIRVNISSFSKSEHVSTGIVDWNSVGINELEAYTFLGENVQHETDNIAYGSTLTASSKSDDAGKAADLDSQTAWTSATDTAHWIQADFGENRLVRTIQVDWAKTNPDSWMIQTAEDGADLSDDASWTTQKTMNTKPSATEQIVLDSDVSARYVRIKMDVSSSETLLSKLVEAVGGVKAADYTAETWAVFSAALKEAKSIQYTDLDEEADMAACKKLNDAWMQLRLVPAASKLADEELEKQYELGIPAQGADSVSISEIRIYGGAPKTYASLSAFAKDIAAAPVAAGDTKLNVFIPVSDNYEVEYLGTDLEQIVDENMTIHAPLTDKTVKVAFKAKDSTGNYEFRELEMVIPGLYEAEETDNAAPVILPELQEWKGADENTAFAFTENSGVWYADDDFKTAAEELAADYLEMTGKVLPVSKGTAPAGKEGQISFAKVTGQALGKEGYTMDIGSSIAITAEHATGAYWSTRTILQAITTSEDGTIAGGIARDYPTYSVRSFILDVGRKSFTMDWLNQMSKMMSWYKMNDFHVHLNDNFIWVEAYNPSGGEDNRDDAYSGFRLESDIKEGGNDGLYKADLTSSDVFYTKDEFRSFIKDSRARGVEIVPEFDAPAHSLAFTKVRPDLRLPDSALPNVVHNGGSNRSPYDHLNLVDYYDECVDFIETVFDEYILGDDPVFDEDTIVHIGADEFESDGTAYRKFINDLFEHIESTGRKTRVWGSLSQIKSATEEVVGAVENEDGTITRRQMNIWNYSWSKPKDMYDLGFELINCNDGTFYIVPNANYYYDYLTDSTMYNNNINSMSGVTIPAGDPQMVGSAFAIWNDMSDLKDNGMSEYDIYDRAARTMGLFAANLWGKQDASLAEAQALRNELNQNVPGVNFGYEVDVNEEGAIASVDMEDAKDASGNGHDLADLVNAEITEADGRKALELKGGNSHATLSDLSTAGLGNSLRVKVKRTSDSTDEQILFESEYGSIKAVQKETGQVGISRELRDYSFNYTLPVGQWVELEIRNEFEVTSLYVNGVLTDTIGTHTRSQLKATCMLPVGTVGSETSSFVGLVDDIRLGTAADFAAVNRLDQKIFLIGSLPAGSYDKAAVAEALKVSGAYNPSEAEVKAAEDALDAVLANAEYEKADYSKVDALLALVPSSYDAFTPASTNTLKGAVGSVVRNYPKASQAAVDSMAEALRNGLDALTAKDFADAAKMDQSTMSVTASTEETEGDPGAAANVLDGNTSTFWHSRWSSPAATANSHYLTLDLGSKKTFYGVEYTPRQGSGSANGILMSYGLDTSDDGVTFTEVKTGTLTQNTDVKTISLDAPAQARYIRLRWVQGSGGFGTCAELNVIGDLDCAAALTSLLNDVKALNSADYTSATWSVLSTKKAAAEALGSDATSQAQWEAYTALAMAMTGLKAA